MKKCLTCNKEFNDDSLFCPECGEMLVSNDTCPQCHKEVKPEDKYCRYCGRKIERIRICSECGKEVDNDTNFCPKCGSKISDDGYIRNSKSYSKQTGATKEQKPLSQMVNYAFITIFGILAVIILVGMFGDILTTNSRGMGIGLSINVGIKYFFGSGAESLKQILDVYKYKEYYTFTMSKFVLENIFYFGGLLGLFTSLVFMVINFVKVGGQKENIKHGPIYGLVISVVPYLFIMAFHNFASESYSGIEASLSFGWGTIMVLVGALLLLCSLIVYDILNSQRDSKHIGSAILHGLVPMVMVIVVIFCTSAVACMDMSTSAGATTTLTVGPTYYPSQMLQLFSSGSLDALPNSAIVAITGYFILLLAALLMISSIYLTLRKKNISSLVIFSVSYIAFIIGSILAVNGPHEDASYWKIGGGSIAMYVLGAAIIAGMVGALVLDRRKEA